VKMGYQFGGGIVVNIPFNASDFSSDIGSWTLAPSDLQTAQYWQNGRFIHLDLDVSGGTIAGTPNFLTYRMPFTAITDSTGFMILFPHANPQPGFVVLSAGSNILQLFRTGGAWQNGIVPLSLEVSIIL
jgi:hypothetical protein